jgi:hypothetical protein
MKGIGGKKEKKAREFIHSVMKNGSVEKGKEGDNMDGEEVSKTDECQTTESKTAESTTKTVESAAKTVVQERSEEKEGNAIICKMEDHVGCGVCKRKDLLGVWWKGQWIVIMMSCHDVMS